MLAWKVYCEAVMSQTGDSGLSNAVIQIMGKGTFCVCVKTTDEKSHNVLNCDDSVSVIPLVLHVKLQNKCVNNTGNPSRTESYKLLIQNC